MFILISSYFGHLPSALLNPFLRLDSYAPQHLLIFFIPKLSIGHATLKAGRRKKIVEGVALALTIELSRSSESMRDTDKLNHHATIPE